jgi:hypothetical protein
MIRADLAAKRREEKEALDKFETDIQDWTDEDLQECLAVLEDKGGEGAKVSHVLVTVNYAGLTREGHADHHPSGPLYARLRLSARSSGYESGVGLCVRASLLPYPTQGTGPVPGTVTAPKAAAALPTARPAMSARRGGGEAGPGSSTSLPPRTGHRGGGLAIRGRGAPRGTAATATMPELLLVAGC